MTFTQESNLSSPPAPAGRPRGVWAFDELRRYHTRPLRLNWGPKNEHFGITHFWDPTIDPSFFLITRRNFFMFCVFTAVPKNSKKNGSKNAEK